MASPCCCWALALGFGCALALARATSDEQSETIEGGLAAVLEQPEEFVRRLLHPYNLSAFYAEVWGREPHHFSRSEVLPFHNADLLPTEPQSALRAFVGGCVSAMDATRGEALQAHKDISLLRSGHMPKNAEYPNIPPAVIDETLDDGYSIVVNWMQFRWPAVAQLAEVFEVAFDHQTNVNLYHTPGNEQAFPLHYDETDVFVMQLSGSKVWALHEPALPFARTDEKRLSDQALQEFGVVEEHTMNPGDLLYIPRGVPHTARNMRTDAPSSHLTVGLHVDLWQTVEGWMHRAVVHWLVSEAAANSKIQTSASKLEKWVPATAVTKFLAVQKMQGDDAARAMMRAERSKRVVNGTGAMATLLHAAVRLAANRLPSFRRAAVFAHTLLQDDWTVAVRALCKKTPTSSKIVEAVRSWNTAGDGLGTIDEFSAALKHSHLALPPTTFVGMASTQWDESMLPFAGAAYEPETASEVHGRGVQGGMGWMTQRDGPGPAPKGAWKAIWGSFCSSMQGSDEDNVDSSAAGDAAQAQGLWNELVEWHAQVRKSDRVRLTKRYALNLEAASLPPLKSLNPM